MCPVSLLGPVSLFVFVHGLLSDVVRFLFLVVVAFSAAYRDMKTPRRIRHPMLNSTGSIEEENAY